MALYRHMGVESENQVALKMRRPPPSGYKHRGSWDHNRRVTPFSQSLNTTIPTTYTHFARWVHLCLLWTFWQI